ncbi:MAG: hypothetical protein QOF01_2056 [Thermomicrobiales bacterium]|nr:hypothetical protein [Thermomicrobiales bacterium]
MGSHRSYTYQPLALSLPPKRTLARSAQLLVIEGLPIIAS